MSNDNIMQGVPENDVLELEQSQGGLPPSTATYPVGNMDPKNRRSSLAQLTREALPRLDHYKNCVQAMKRPSLGELHGEPSEGKDGDPEAPSPNEMGGSHGVKLGWIQGVLIPCLLNIWGVMLFLRLSWVVAQSGISCSYCDPQIQVRLPID